MSSSVIRRNAQLTILDDKFEEFYAGYDDMNVGGLEADDIEGSRNVTSLDKGTAHKGILPPFQKSGNASPTSTVTWSLRSFLRMTTRRPVSMKGLRCVSSSAVS